MDYVLVHGAWQGAWCWRRVLPGLWAAGHRAFAVSLSGVGERAHQLRPGIGLQQHADDVCAVIDAEELQDAVLVGHSYGGVVITAVADRMPRRLSQLVYVDAVVPEPGESWSSGHTAATQASRRAAIEATGSIPPAEPAAFGLQGDDAAWVARRQTPQPGGVYDDPLRFDPRRIAALPRTFIDCTLPALATIDVARRRVRAAADWNIVELATGHAPMVSAPADLLAALLAVGADPPNS